MDKHLADNSMQEYLGSRGIAYVEVLALFDEIKGLIERGYSISAIFRMYSDKQKIAAYTFNTFRRAILKADLKAKRSNRTAQDAQQEQAQQNSLTQRPRPHEVQHTQRRQYISMGSGVDHIGLSK